MRSLLIQIDLESAVNAARSVCNFDGKTRASFFQADAYEESLGNSGGRARGAIRSALHQSSE